jgi:hypothetical protein
MQKRSLLILAAILVVGATAQSATPPAPAALTPAALGLVNGILSYCIKIDQADASKFESLRHSLIPASGQGEHDGDHDRDAWEAAQKDPSYQASFTLVENSFEGMPASAARQLCLGAF